MSETEVQTWKGTPFTIERKAGKSPSTVIIRMCGPFTARDMYGTLTPDEMQAFFDMDPAPGEASPTLNVLDLTSVPYVDSMGLGMLVTHHVHCHNRGIRMVAAGMGPRVLQLLKLTKVDGLFPMAATVADAEAN